VAAPQKLKSTRNRAIPRDSGKQLVVITGMSGSGKASVMKAFEDLGYYCVDNMPIGLVPRFADLVKQSSEIEKAALVTDIREGEQLKKLPQIIRNLKRQVSTTVLFLEASDEILLRRFSETRRPHPLGKDSTVKSALSQERRRLQPIRAMADMVVDSSRFNVHELRSHITAKFTQGSTEKDILISLVSFGYKTGVPLDADLVFDVRFLPNPHFVPEFRPLTGRHPKVAKYIRSFSQTQEFIRRISDLLVYLIPHYVREGKSYLTIAFGCTGGQHRSVLISEEVKRLLAKSGYQVKVIHRDCPK
jgi:UPF0042 nucleotide-binding protein